MHAVFQSRMGAEASRWRAAAQEQGVAVRTFVLRTQTGVDRLCKLLQATWKEQFDAGRPLEVLVSEFKKKRSDAQNRLYWLRLEGISQQVVVAGRRHPKESYHELFKRKFIGYEELPDGGGIIGLSTTTLDAREFSDYIGKIEAWAAEEHGVIFDDHPT